MKTDKPDKLEKKSPLKVEPLRGPGQSLQEQIDNLLYGKVFTWLVFGVIAIMLAVMEWLRWFFKTPPQPVTMTILAVCFCIFVFLKTKKLFPQIRQLKLGMKGEKIVGQSLEKLRAIGYRVFHDIPGDGFNIDHVLIGPGGIFAIETKTIKKPSKGRSEVVFNGETITIDGQTPDRDPIAQVRAESQYLTNIILKTTGQEVSVRSVLLYPGWYTRDPRRHKIWVLNETYLTMSLESEEAKLNEGEICRISEGLTMYLRNRPENNP